MWTPFINFGLAIALVTAKATPTLAAESGAPQTIVVNDNTRAAGVDDAGTVTIRLRAASGQWQPEGSAGPALTTDAFGEEGAPLTVPAPLIRVVEGATIAVSVRNELRAPLRIHGFCTRDGSPCAPLVVAPGSTSHVRFASGRAGTYHYWATTLGAPVPFRELAGALIVDPPGAVAPDRVFAITEWSTLTAAELGEIFSADDPNEVFVRLHPKVAFVINGLSWPATERLTYRRGESVRWRVVNLSSQTHPMHLHGFYFTVTHMGNGARDDSVDAGRGRQVVTQMVPPGGTMTMEWTPEREGRWLFHCHVMHHVSPDRRIGTVPTDPHRHDASGAHAHAARDPSLGMAGMVLGITVLPSSGTAPTVARTPSGAPRRLTMILEAPPAGAEQGPGGVGISLVEMGRAESGTPSRSPGPPVALTRGETAEITVVNRLTEPTSMHWHGLELESVYDGVHGWSGRDRQVAPMIPPGGSFVVRITPPRTGTFIYHTHLHDYRQLTAGLYGPLIVTEPGEAFDPSSDHAVVIGRWNASEASSILEEPSSVEVNGARDPRLVWRAGTRQRIRLINITPDDIFTISLTARGTPVTWLPLTKDGAPIAASAVRPVAATVQIAVGETYDFVYDAPPGPASLWLEVRTSSGRWQAQAHVIVK